ncbi:MAG: hypothetical protein HYU48_01495 [Candidatus Levybacteria bacterium]|nr:hypothetical protein [Candidatus Levybacteria bacterium]
MQSIIIVTRSSEIALYNVRSICDKNKIASIDRSTNTFEKAVGIEDVRNIQKKLYLKPIKSKDKAVIINAPNGFTIEAQSALLKILEEPPQNTFIILIVENKNSLLETVLSRCSIIEIKDKLNFSEDELSELLETLKNLDSMGIGDKLKLAQDFGTNKEEALIFLEKLIFLARDKLIKSPGDKKALWNLKEFQEAYAITKTTNATARLSLENLFLAL